MDLVAHLCALAVLVLVALYAEGMRQDHAARRRFARRIRRNHE